MMKTLFCLLALISLASCAYNPKLALKYVNSWWNSTNHNCNTQYDSCTPWSYWGMESCGFSSHGGDCANFVSQSLVSGGHPYLNSGFPCRGYPCGKEEVGAKNLGDCLATVHSWKRTCGYKIPPPSSLKVGDVLIYHQSSCTDEEAHATIVTSVGSSASEVKISCHSPDTLDQAYPIFISVKPYLEWLQINP